MNRIAFGPATVESGKNKGAARLLSFATGIKPENNATGLPVENGKVFVQVSPGAFTVQTFDSADEVRAAAGDQFDTFVVEAANDRMKSTVRSKITAWARKLSLAASDAVSAIQDLADSIDPASLFVAESASAAKGPRGIKAELAAVAANAESMSKEDLLAIIAKLSAK